jgi:hypothetical protein
MPVYTLEAFFSYLRGLVRRGADAILDALKPAGLV